MYRANNTVFKLTILILTILSIIRTTESRRRQSKKKQNCYDKLGVSTDASEREIKKKFRKLAMKYHPDKVQDEDKESAEEKFKELAVCYEILSDEDKRRKYDASGYNEQFEQHGGPGGGSFHFEGSFEDIFKDFFGNGNGRGFESAFGGSSGSPFESFGFGSMGDMFGGGGSGGRGGRGDQQRQRQRQQQNMYGQHHEHEPRTQQQQQRKNRVKAEKIYVDLEDVMDDSLVTVSTKRGRKMDIEIPRGCPEGYILNENGMEFEIYTRKHSDFVRGVLSHKSDLYKNVSITLDAALLGFELEIMTLDNELINLFIDKIPDSKQYQIKRKGLPRFKGDTRGHLYINFDVEFPDLTSKQKENLKHMIEDDGEWDYSEARKYRKKQRDRQKRRNKDKNKNKNEL